MYICAVWSFCKALTRRALDLVSINHNVGIRRFTSTSVGRLRKMSSNKNKSHAMETGKAQMPSTERLMKSHHRFGILSTSLPVFARTKACAHTLSSNSSCSLALALTHGILSLFRSLCPPNHRSSLILTHNKASTLQAQHSAQLGQKNNACSHLEPLHPETAIFRHFINGVNPRTSRNCDGLQHQRLRCILALKE